MEPDTDQTQPAKHRTTIQIAAGAATILIALVIAVLTLTPSVSPPPTGLALSDKIYHAIAFASLLFPAAAAYPTSVPRIAGAAFAYGALIEVIQPLVGRDAELADLVANTVGILFGIALGWGLQAITRLGRAAHSGSRDR